MNVRRSTQVLAKKTPGLLRRFVKRAFVPDSFILWLYPSPRTGHARSLEDKLWGGFSRYALKDLEALKRSRRANAEEASYAAWALARWHAAERDYERAYENVVLMRLAAPSKREDMGQVLLEADCLIRLGDREAARTLLEEMLQLRPGDPNLCLAMANTYAPLEGCGAAKSDAVRLSWINRIYEKANLRPIAKANPARPLGLDNLTGAGACAPAAIGDEPQVTVIMPVYKAEATLPFALRGVLEQSWQNLEIIVVDDCSPDNSFAIAEEFARRDARVRAVRQEKNRGAYVARNRGLELATGDFVTTHDADDWSHPQKIERQVRHIEDENLVGNLTAWARVFPHLWVKSSSWPSSSFLHTNNSSFLARREIFNALGGWDRVRITADTELIWRVKCYADREPTLILNQIPMSLALDDTSSLTQAGATHIRTIYHGVRREYREASAHWHNTIEALDGLRLCDYAERRFPAPGMIVSDREEHIETDLLLIMDFNLGAGAGISALGYLQAALSCGLSVAVFHWRRYNLDVRKPLNADIRQIAHEGRVRVVAPGEKVRASTVIVGYPVILQYAIDLCPKVEFDSFVVLVNQMAARLTTGGDVQYDPLQVRENLRELFGTEGLWAPISERVRCLMLEDERYPSPHPEIWTPLIDTTAWCADPLHWRGRERKRPVVGRHGRDHYTKWPSSPEALRAAYCAATDCDVVIMGGAKCALDVIDGKPENWTVHAFGAMEPRAFLSSLDFFVHYPREDQIEAFGRAPMEAMAVGVPVILPPVFRESFGDAALYAEPEEVWGVIEALWRDEDAYLMRAKIGRDFVLGHCGYDQLPKRLKNLARVDRNEAVVGSPSILPMQRVTGAPVGVDVPRFSERLAKRRRLWSKGLWQRRLVNKLEAKRFAEGLGVPVPKLYWHGTDVSELPTLGLPATFVLKPLYGHSAKGVVLVYQGMNNLTGKKLNWETITQVRKRYEDGALVEEYLPTATGRYDFVESYKVFVFAETCVIRVNNEQFDRTKQQIRCIWDSYFTEDWTPIPGRVSTYAEPGPNLPEPRHLEELLVYARRLGKAYETFVRVDFYLTPDGPRFGEFCSNPYAGKHWTEYGEQLFGSLWEENLGDAI